MRLRIKGVFNQNFVQGAIDDDLNEELIGERRKEKFYERIGYAVELFSICSILRRSVGDGGTIFSRSMTNSRSE